MEKKDLCITISIKELKDMNERLYTKAKNIADLEIINSKKILNPIWYSKDMQLGMGGEQKVNTARYVAFKAAKLANEEYLTKCVIASNIAFNDDKTFIRLLMEAGYSYGSLYTLAIFIEKLNLILNVVNELKIEELDLNCNEVRHIENIRNLMSRYYGINDYQLIANKIIEVVAKQKDLCLEYSQNVKTR